MRSLRRSCGIGLLVWSGLAVYGVPLWGQAPTGLAAKSATSKQIVLTWNGVGASYTVQRAPLGGSYSNLGTASTTSYTDTTIDPYTTYQYQVLNGAATSNSITVGPPPSGVTNAAPAPVVGNTPSDSYGYNLAMTLDGNGDPAFLFIWDDPTGTTDRSKDQLLFRSWNRAQYAWNPVVRLAVVGDVTSTSRAVASLAYDSNSSTFAAAAEAAVAGGTELQLYTSSDGGLTWTLKNRFSNTGGSVLGPSLALRQGSLFLAYEQDAVGATYVTGQLNQSPSTWTTKHPPAFAGTGLPIFDAGPSLALDSAGNPGVAYWAQDSTGNDNGTLLFWKPSGSAAPVKVMDSNGHGDGTNVKLLYSNLNPRVLVWVNRGDFVDGAVDGLHFAHSEDGGLTWSTPGPIPPDGNASADFPFDLALDSKGTAAAAFGQNSGTGDNSHHCPGGPRLAFSTSLTSFTTCPAANPAVAALTNANLASFGGYPAGVQIGYGGNDKLYLLWLEASDAQATTGVLMYREPPASAITGPSIISVSDGASFRPSIVAGSWVTIKGVNLSNTTRIWSGSDFNNGNNLPTALDGVSVKINGLSAAVYYVSPGQLNVQAPAPLSGSVPVQVTVNGAASNIVTANAAGNAPGLFAYSAGGKTYPAAVFPNGLIVGDPSISGNAVAEAKDGDVIEFYATGIGASPAGTIVNSPIAFPDPLTVTIGGQNASVQFGGLVASGEFQINVLVPNLAPGEYPVIVTAHGQSSQSGVVVPVQ